MDQKKQFERLHYPIKKGPLAFFSGFLIGFPVFLKTPVVPVPLPLGFFFILIFFISVILWSNLTNKKTYAPTTWSALILIYMGLIGVIFIFSIPATSDVKKSFFVASQFGAPCLAFFFVCHLQRHAGAVYLIGKGIYFATVSASALIVFGQMGLWPTLNFQDVNPSFYGPLSFYQYRQYIGGFLATGMLMGLFLANKERSMNFFLALSAALVVAAIFGIGSTLGISLAAISAILIAVSIFPLVVFFPVAILVFIWFLIFFTDSYWLSQYVTDFSRMGGRFDVWSHWVLLAKSAGAFGEGFVFGQDQNRLYGSHAQPLDFFLRGGIPFLLGWLFIVLYTFYRSYVLLFRTHNVVPAPIKRAIFTGLFGQIVLSSVVVVPFQQPLTGTLIWVLIGLQELLIRDGQKVSNNALRRRNGYCCAHRATPTGPSVWAS